MNFKHNVLLVLAEINTNNTLNMFSLASIYSELAVAMITPQSYLAWTSTSCARCCHVAWAHFTIEFFCNLLVPR